jgi:hypothetical protein
MTLPAKVLRPSPARAALMGHCSCSPSSAPLQARIGQDGGGECGSCHILSHPLIRGGGPTMRCVAGEEEPGRWRTEEEDRRGRAQSVEEWS